jgi:protein involved in sex pheromone biosynthesis
MKRLCIIVSLVLVFLLSSCTNSVDDETHWLFDGSFNSSANTKEEVLDKIEFYKGELETIIGEGYESEFSKL